jgi:hypothetical protein
MTYDPTVGRWLTMDPIGFDADDANLYRYAWNSVTSVVDRDGLWGTALGHHYFPLAEQARFASKMTDAARRLAEGYYTGQTDPNHCFNTYGGYTHSQYNKAVRKEFEKYLKDIGKDKSGKVNMQEMRDFIENRIRNGKNKIIKKFNAAVEKLIKPAPKRVNPSKLTNDELNDLGKKFRQNRRGFVSARLLGALAVTGGLALSQTEGFLDVCSDSPYLRRAYDAAARGDSKGTRQALLGSATSGGKTGLYDELISEGLPIAALDFRVAMEQILDDIASDVSRPIGDADE